MGSTIASSWNGPFGFPIPGSSGKLKTHYEKQAIPYNCPSTYNSMP